MDGDMDFTTKTRSCLKNMSRKFRLFEDFCMETIESLDSQYQTAQATLENLYSEFVEEFIPLLFSHPNNDSVTLDDDSSDQHTNNTESHEYFSSEEVLTNDESLVDTPLLQSDDTNLVPNSTTHELLVNKPLDESNDHVGEKNLSLETPKSVPPALSDSTDDIYSIIRPKEVSDYALELEALLREQEEWGALGGVGEFSRSFCSSESMSKVSTNDDVFGVKPPNEENDYDLQLEALLREQQEWGALGGVGRLSRSFCSSESLSEVSITDDIFGVKHPNEEKYYDLELEALLREQEEWGALGGVGWFSRICSSKSLPEVSIDYTNDIFGVEHPNKEKDYDLEVVLREQEEWRALGGVGVFSRSFLSEISNDFSVDSCSDGKSDDFYSATSDFTDAMFEVEKSKEEEEENDDRFALTLSSSAEGMASRKPLLSYREFCSSESSSKASNGRSDDSSEGELEDDCATELFMQVTRPFIKDLMDGCCFAPDNNACASYVSSEAQIAHDKETMGVLGNQVQTAQTTLYDLNSGSVEQETPSVSSNPNNDVTLDSSSIQETSNSAHLMNHENFPSEATTKDELLVYTPLQRSDDTNLVPEAITDELIDNPLDQRNDLVEEKNLSPETPKSNKEEEEDDQFPLQTSMTKTLEDLSTSAGVSSGISLFSLARSSCSSESLSGVSNDGADCDGESAKSDDCSSNADYGRSDDGSEGEREDDCATEADNDDLMQPFEKEVDEIHPVMIDDKQHVSISLSGVTVAPYFQVFEPESFEFVDADEADYTLADQDVKSLDDHDASDADWEIV